MSDEKRPGDVSPAGKDKKNRSGQSMAAYIKKLIPSKAIIDFVYKEDFDGDGMEEALVGYTELIPFPPETSVIWVKAEGEDLSHVKLMPDIGRGAEQGGVFDNAAVADTDGDGLPELVLSLSAGSGHYISVVVCDWAEGTPVSYLIGKEPLYHGSMEVADIDNDGIHEVITDRGTMEGSEILSFDEAGYHMRKSCCYKWDGLSYKASACEVRMPYLSFNKAVLFIQYLWQQEYKKAYDMVIMPGFVGLSGLDDSSINEFKKYVNRMVRPVLRKNLSKSRLVPSEPYENYCLFSGIYDDISVELVNKDGQILVQSLGIHKKIKL